MSSKPYAEMTETELDAELGAAIEERRRRSAAPLLVGDVSRQSDRTVPISIRVPSRLLARLKREAERRGVPYQRLLLTLAEEGLIRPAGPIAPARIRIPAEALRDGHVVIDLELLPPAASQ
jgi:predicted DNA binding CopG/RHH family protein